MATKDTYRWPFTCYFSKAFPHLGLAVAAAGILPGTNKKRDATAQYKHFKPASYVIAVLMDNPRPFLFPTLRGARNMPSVRHSLQ